ncbi:hypothetical protein AAFF_G00352340 [Aldrovandia affinis]|uniref:Uncharacterized protein n=1 Tax=Aldrovandia affinis TaxID=143900 RepID=A0AAD7SK10_9TELE|nr:hypothetical protein AAFF_G00352340 [Aldrovandia affinis]
MTDNNTAHNQHAVYPGPIKARPDLLPLATGACSPFSGERVTWYPEEEPFTGHLFLRRHSAQRAVFCFPAATRSNSDAGPRTLTLSGAELPLLREGRACKLSQPPVSRHGTAFPLRASD